MPIETRPPTLLTESPTNLGRPWQEHLLLLLWVSVLGLSLVGMDPHLLYAIHAVCILVSLTLHVSMRPWSFRLIMVTQLAFLMLFVGELFTEYDLIRRVTSLEHLEQAVQYTSAAHAAVLVGYWGWFSEIHPSVEVKAPKPIGSVAHRSDTLVVLFFALLFLLFFSDFGRQALNVALYGRQRTVYSADAVSVVRAGLSSAAGVALPALLFHWILHVRQRAVIVAVIAILPVVITHFASGTRFYLLFSVVSPLAMAYAGTRLSIGIVARTLGVGVSLIMAASLTRAIRGFGVAGSDDLNMGSVQAALSQSEGVLLINAQLVDYFQRFDHMGGRSLSSMLLFWIPRQVWPDKPTLIGFWFPRAYGLRVESGFSAAAGFCGDPYADFGFYGGLLTCAIGGFLVAYLEGRVATWLIRREEASAIGAVLFGAAFFGMRSPDTAFINLMGAIFWWVCYVGVFRLTRVRGPVMSY